VKAYLDASVLVALFVRDALTVRSEAFLRAHAPLLIVSDFAAAEFASAIARRVRMGEIVIDDAHIAFSNFDIWTERATQREEIRTADIKAAEAFLRRLDLNLRTADAVNIAIARRLDAALVTFDEKMAASARVLGTPVVAA
jgi:predicted nucleic acid-binding protein